MTDFESLNNKEKHAECISIIAKISEVITEYFKGYCRVGKVLR